MLSLSKASSHSSRYILPCQDALLVLRGAEGILRFGGDVRRDLGPSLALNGD